MDTREDMSEISYYCKSRRQFLKLSGLALGGLVLPWFWPHQASGKDVSSAESVETVDRAAAMALHDACMEQVTHVPATGALNIYAAYNEIAGQAPSYAFNEELAYTMAHSAAMAGVRSAAIVKSHGLAKAANSVVDSLTLGNASGFVVMVMDDPEGRHSDSIFDLKAFLQGTGIPFKVAGKKTIYDDVLACCLWSEKLQTPVALIFNAAMVFWKPLSNASVWPRIVHNSSVMHGVMCCARPWPATSTRYSKPE